MYILLSYVHVASRLAIAHYNSNMIYEITIVTHAITSVVMKWHVVLFEGALLRDNNYYHSVLFIFK